jgi:hypothetical protein
MIAAVITAGTWRWGALARGAWRVGPLVAALLVLVTAGSGCARRLKLADVDLEEARESESLGNLRVYPSNRMISNYDEPALRTVVVEREIRQSSRRERRKVILRRSTAGAIVGEDLLNGQKLLYVTFGRTCSDPSCAYGFVQLEDARYVLVHVPKRGGYAPAKVYRSLVLKRHRMKIGHVRALSDANQVYKLERRRRSPVVFLEVKRANQDRVEERAERESGV